MTAQEFIKQYGWEFSINLSKNMVGINQEVANCIATWGQSEWDNLKQLVDAWELVQKHGGLTKCQFIIVDPLTMWDTSDLKQAIVLVESVNENN